MEQNEKKREFTDLTVVELDEYFKDLKTIPPSGTYYMVVLQPPIRKDRGVETVKELKLNEAMPKSEALHNHTTGPKLGYVVSVGKPKVLRDQVIEPEAKQGDIIYLGTGNFSWILYREACLHVWADHQVNGVIRQEDFTDVELNMKVNKNNNRE